MFADEGFTTGTFNERFLAFLNNRMGTDYGDANATSKGGLPGAMQAFAAANGAANWDALDEIPAP